MFLEWTLAVGRTRADLYFVQGPCRGAIGATELCGKFNFKVFPHTHSRQRHSFMATITVILVTDRSIRRLDTSRPRGSIGYSESYIVSKFQPVVRLSVIIAFCLFVLVIKTIYAYYPRIVPFR